MEKQPQISVLLKENWPAQLLEIPDIPKQLYIRGSVPNWEHRCVAVVGSRKYTPYGKEVCQTLIKGLAGYPVTILSGLALGIDSIAHEAALTAGLTTVAIPGSGLDPEFLYPPSNRRLAERIIKSGGALISEFEPDARAQPYFFPKRNRIMAGIAHAILVIEAEIPSGTLITSRLATDYNREVCAVPGSIFSKHSEGCHMLIRLGATPITCSQDLLEVLGFSREEAADASARYKDCSPQELQVLSLLSAPQSREKIIEKMSLPISEATAVLMILEIKGLIKETMGELHRT